MMRSAAKGVVSKNGTAEFEDLSMIVETYKQFHQELERDLHALREQAEDEDRTANRRINNMKRAIEVAEADNWNAGDELDREEFQAKIPRSRIHQYVA